MRKGRGKRCDVVIYNKKCIFGLLPPFLSHSSQISWNFLSDNSVIIFDLLSSVPKIASEP